MKHLHTPFKASLLTAAISLASSPLTIASDFMLEEIVVTAQKRAQSLQDVAVTVSAVSDTMLDNSGIASIGELQTVVPNLSIVSSNSLAQTSISIRGAGTGGSNPTLEPSVGIFVDGVFMPRSVFGISDLVDVEQVEVLAGPQGTLYGKNTNAGVISISTKKPSDAFEANIEQSLGSYGLTDTKASISGPIADNLTYRLTTRQRRRDGTEEGEYNNEEYNQIDRQSYRGMLEWTPSENLTIRPTLYYSLEDSNIGSGETYLDPNGPLSNLVSSLNGGALENSSATDHEKSLTHATKSRLEVQGASIQLDYDFDQFSLTSITSYQEWRNKTFSDGDETSINLTDNTDRVEEDSIAQEFRFTSNSGGDLEWVAGLFYFKSHLNRGDADEPFTVVNDALAPFSTAYGAAVAGLLNCAPPATPAAAQACQGAALYSAYTPGGGFRLESNHDTESIAVYGQASYSLSDNTKLNVGLRFGREEKDFDYVTSVISSGTPSGNGFTSDLLVNTLSSNASGSDDLSESDVSGMVSINHFIGNAMLYASVSTGSKSGGFNGDFSPSSIEDRSFDTEETINYEIGAKFEGLMDGRARANISYFYTEYTDFQSAYFDSARATFVVDNAGRQTTQGIDLDGTLAASENLTLSARLSYLNAMYRDYEDAACSSNSGIAVGANGLCDLTGTRMPFAPSLSGSITADYIYPIENGDFYSNFTLAFKTDHNTSSTYIPQGSDESYETLNIRFGYRTDQWDVSLWGKNITNENHSMRVRGYTTASIIAGSAGSNDNSYVSAISDPATYGVTFSYNFM